MLAIGGCGEHRSLGGDWPEGTLVVARTEALARLLARLQRLEGTRLARRAGALAGALPDCEWVEGQELEGRPADVWSHLTCRPADSALAGLDRERGDRDLAFALPANGGARTLGTLAIADDGDVDIEVLLPRSAFAGTWALTLPGAEPPGTPLLSHADELVHARLRPEGGLDIGTTGTRRKEELDVEDGKHRLGGFGRVDGALDRYKIVALVLHEVELRRVDHQGSHHRVLKGPGDIGPVLLGQPNCFAPCFALDFAPLILPPIVQLPPIWRPERLESAVRGNLGERPAIWVRAHKYLIAA